MFLEFLSKLRSGPQEDSGRLWSGAHFMRASEKFLPALAGVRTRNIQELGGGLYNKGSLQKKISLFRSRGTALIDPDIPRQRTSGSRTSENIESEDSSLLVENFPAPEGTRTTEFRSTVGRSSRVSIATPWNRPSSTLNSETPLPPLWWDSIS